MRRVSRDKGRIYLVVADLVADERRGGLFSSPPCRGFKWISSAMGCGIYDFGNACYGTFFVSFMYM